MLLLIILHTYGTRYVVCTIDILVNKELIVSLSICSAYEGRVTMLTYCHE